LTVFGDSLSDDGIEVDENSHGFVRNSNGPVWPEYLNKMLACDKYVNYAHSGAKSGYDNVYFSGWSGVLWQIESFLANSPAIPPGQLSSKTSFLTVPNSHFGFLYAELRGYKIYLFFFLNQLEEANVFFIGLMAHTPKYNSLSLLGDLS
uniref:Sinapine esterase n=1 Tax=Toxocara canis TaxID=6265 RepID=A0A183U3R9_TOXCA